MGLSIEVVMLRLLRPQAETSLDQSKDLTPISIIMATTSKIRLVHLFGKQLRQTKLHEISFSTAPQLLKDGAASGVPTHTGQVVIIFSIRLKGDENDTYGSIFIQNKISKFV